MGLNGSIVIFPPCRNTSPDLISRVLRRAPLPPPCPTSISELRVVAKGILTALEDLQLIAKGTTKSSKADRESTFATCEVLDRPPAGLLWTHIAVSPRALRSSMADLVYIATEQQWSGDVETPDDPDALAVPLLHVTCLSQPISLTEAGRRVVATSWAFLEFSYEGARLSDDIHTIRNPSHPLFARLGTLLGGPVKWAVAVG